MIGEAIKELFGLLFEIVFERLILGVVKVFSKISNYLRQKIFKKRVN